MPAPEWEVEGVDPETREAAIMAARRAGLSLAAWLNKTIRKAATEQLKHAGGGPGRYDSPEEAVWVPMPPGSADWGEAKPRAPTAGAMLETIQGLSRRPEEVEARSLQSLQPMRERMDRLSQEIDAIKGRTGVSTAPLERAISRLSERIQALETPSSDEKRESRKKRSLFGRAT